jgi:hypothetical protein
MIGEKAIDDSGIDHLAADQIDAGFVKDADIAGGIEASHGNRS